MKRINRIFIANRGEIARRIGKTCRKLSIKTVGISHSETPPEFLAEFIDDFVFIQEQSSSAYLDMQSMVSLAKEYGCDAIHPGFGFLSENSAFASLTVKEGLIFIGPSPETMDSMASKDTARNIAEKHNVPIIPGAKAADLEAAKNISKEIGFPLLIKAAMGGGGKGMRIVAQESALEESLERAASEAQSAFGDSTLIIERYLKTPRHIEIQILGDLHGQVITLGERDCSIQRRHQKIIEESPAPGLSHETQSQLKEAAIRLAKAVQFSNAGTIEFLVDWSNPDKEQPFYFLEMNTRLQVEHPVTEEVFGIDLVEWQIKTAEGEQLPPHFLTLRPSGHAIEARIYAEDAEANFLPSPGPIKGFFPYQGGGVRWEIGIDPIDQISPAFDPMIAKVIAWAPSREEAAQKLAETLKHSLIVGTRCNREFLFTILMDHSFMRSIPSTSYLGEHMDRLVTQAQERRQHHSDRNRALCQQLMTSLPHQEQHATPLEKLTRRVFSQTVSASPVCKKSYRKGLSQAFMGIFGGSDECCWMIHQDPGQITTSCQREGFLYSIEELRHEGSPTDGDDLANTAIQAPVPGKVVKILIKSGDIIEKNQVIAVLESMKMEFEVRVAKAGIIDKINVGAGDQVEADDILANWRPKSTEV